MALDDEKKDDFGVEEIDAMEGKPTGRRLVESEIPAEQRKAEARLM